MSTATITGGTLGTNYTVSTVNNIQTITFLTVSSYSVTFSAGTDVSYIVVGGGGGGGISTSATGGTGGGGGGGGGGQVLSGKLTITAGTYAVTVGGGGAGAPSPGDATARGAYTATGGSVSNFSNSITANGGLAGQNARAGTTNGGGDGGASGGANTGGAGSMTSNIDGASGASGGGGGGGGNLNNSAGGTGGAGITVFNGLTYGGGGGGGSGNNHALGGIGGSTNGGEGGSLRGTIYPREGGYGLSNTGGGGGGNAAGSDSNINDNGGIDAGSGGSGVVILIFKTTSGTTGGTTTTTTTTTTPCFKENSLILTAAGYKKIQDLRKGDLIKTWLDGFVPIYAIGKKKIYHPASKKRFKDQLYKCTNDAYPEVFEDLVITGCHSILVDDFKEGEREKTFDILKDIYVTDKKYRLPACVDKRSVVYETPGEYTIYHFALEHDNKYMNYGVYANGLLVETCSKRFIIEKSNMTLIK